MCFLLDAIVAASVYAAFYRDVPVKFKVSGPLIDDISVIPIDLGEIYPGSFIDNQMWNITNKANGPINLRISFNGITICPPENLTCSVVYTPLIMNKTGVYMPTPMEYSLNVGYNELWWGINVSSGSDIGEIVGNFTIERI